MKRHGWNSFGPEHSGSILEYNARCYFLPRAFLIHVKLKKVFDSISTVFYVNRWMCLSCDRIDKLNLAFVEYRDRNTGRNTGSSYEVVNELVGNDTTRLSSHRFPVNIYPARRKLSRDNIRILRICVRSCSHWFFKSCISKAWSSREL